MRFDEMDEIKRDLAGTHKALARRAETESEADVQAFTTRSRNSIRAAFKSDHDIRLTELAPRASIGFWPTGLWQTQSWITYGELRDP